MTEKYETQNDQYFSVSSNQVYYMYSWYILHYTG